jgi:hypothetical protein
MLTEEIRQKKLLELGINKAPDVVEQIVTLLQSGASKYSIYSQNKKSGLLASINTVMKIEQELNKGNLDWMLNELETVLDEMVKASDEDQQTNLANLSDTFWSRRYTDDGWGKYRLKVTKEAEYSLKDWGWSIGNLKHIGIPSEEALSIVQEYDRLSMARQSSVVGSGLVEAEKPQTYREYLEGLDQVITDGHPLDHMSSSQKSNETTWYLRKFQGFERYLYLHNLVYLLQNYPHAKFHYKFACLASEFYTRGKMPDVVDVSIEDQGEDLLRYEVWDEGENLKAYYKSLKRYKRSAKSNRVLKARIDALLKGVRKTVKPTSNGYY